MTKNMTRKGLALGASIAVAASALVGFAAPANAAATLTVLPKAGTSLTFISGETYSVKVIGRSFAATDELRWEITGIDTGETVTATGNGGESVTGTTTKVVDPTTVATTPGGNELGVAVLATEAATVNVRAYIESGDAAGFNATYDTIYSEPVAVSFVKPADVVATVTITQPYENDTAVAGSFVTNVNNEQLLETDFGVYITDGTGADLAGATYAKVVVSPSAFAEEKFSWTSTGAVTGLTKDAAVKAQVLYNNGGVKDNTNPGVLPLAEDANDKNTVLANAATASVTAATTGTLVTDLVSSTSANATSDAFAAGDATFQIGATLKDADGVAVAGKTVTFDFSSTAQADVDLGTGADDAKITIGGTLYNDETKLPGDTGFAKVSATTDANGVAKVTISTDNFADADLFEVVAEYGTLDATLYSATAETVAYELFVVNADEILSTVDGSAAVAQVEVKDQFGGSIADGYDVRANRTTAAQATAGTTGMVNNANIVSGKASISLLDNGTGVGTDVYTLTVEKRLNGGAYDTALASATITGFKVEITTAAKLAANQVALAVTTGDVATTTTIERTGGALELADFGNYKSRDVVGTAPTLDAGFSIEGTVKVKATATTASNNVAGVAVTVTGTGLQFEALVNQNGDGADESIYATDSITTYTDENGVYDVYVSSNKAGKQTVSVTVGSTTQLVEIDFGVAAARSGTVLTIAATGTEPGKTMVFTGKLVDKYGNAVDTDQDAGAAAGATALDATDARLTVTYSGPGFAVAALPVETDANGEFVVRVLLGANDSGAASVTATYGAANGTIATADTGANKDVVTTTQVNIGAPVSTVAAFTKRVGDTVKVVSQGSAKVEFRINGKKVASRSTLGTLNRTFDLVDGKNVVEIYVAGKRVKRVAYTK